MGDTRADETLIEDAGMAERRTRLAARIARWALPALLTMLVVLAGCASSSDDAAPATTAPFETSEGSEAAAEPTGTFSGDVLPILEENCARCHTGDGPGTGHVRMDTVGDVVANADLITAAVQADVMPPWPASDASVDFADDWSLSAGEKAALLDWASFRPEADLPDDHRIVSTVGVRGLDDVDQVVSPEGGYDGVAYQPDEYRCFVYDPGFTETTWIRAYDFVPDQAEVVHHAIGTRVPAELRAEADARAAASDDGQGGWTCFGNTGVGDEDLFLGWAPGQGPTEYPDGSGLRMEPGDFLVIQIHYHFEVDAPEDRSTIELDILEAGEPGADGDIDEIEVVEFLAPAEIPCAASEEGPLCDRNAARAAAIDKYGPEGVFADFVLAICDSSVDDYAHMTDGLASASCDLPARTRGTIVSVLGHEHELGKSFRMTLNPGEPDERLLLDIPEWSFDWQLNYYPVDDIEISPGDVVRIECSWDRSLRDDNLEPAYVLWADGTDDEMCFAAITVRSR